MPMNDDQMWNPTAISDAPRRDPTVCANMMPSGQFSSCMIEFPHTFGCQCPTCVAQTFHPAQYGTYWFVPNEPRQPADLSDETVERIARRVAELLRAP